jgi:hypothetical protein
LRVCRRLIWVCELGIKLTGSHAKLKRTAGIVSHDSVRAMINSARATVSALPSFTPADAPKP